MIARDSDKAGVSDDMVLILESSGMIESCFALGGDSYRRVISGQPASYYTETQLPGIQLAHEISTEYRGKPVTSMDYLYVIQQTMILIEGIDKAMKQVGYENLTSMDIKDGLDSIKDLDTGGLGFGVGFADYPGDRLALEAIRVTRLNMDTNKVEGLSDWIKCPGANEFK